MRTESMFIHAYQGQTTINPLALIILAVLIIFLLFAERKNAVISFLIMACFVSSAQRLVVFGLDFNLIRILILFGWLRVLFRGETSAFEMKPVDWLIILLAVSNTIAYTLLRESSGALIYKLGMAFDSVGMYFLFRCLVRDWDDVRHLAVAIAYLSIPVSLFFLLEKMTGHNVFSIFGGVPEETIVRHGKLRAQGAYAHAILAGVFWATQIPIIMILWWGDKKGLAVVGVVCSLIIVIACASSTPVMGVAAVLVGLGMFVLSRQMRVVWWAGIAALVVLHLVMKAPVWNLIARVDIVGGSTGYHRYMLIDQTIKHFSDWWLIGIISTADWGWFLFDTANEYVNTAVRGGLLSLLIFVAILALSFKSVGEMIRTNESDGVPSILPWLLGVALFSHCVVFIGVAYFGQAIVIWYLLLAMLASLAAQAERENR